ncbi:reverse transcriptase family protein [Alishewanella sp. HL-SH05]|uniref:reverse transcriptase family protein n=1 Tax=Alishewanella sp. HL-SH05 TaxID=3461145 RepID=UPI0040437388
MNAAPLLVSFNSIDKYLEALPEKQRCEYSSALFELHSRQLPPVSSAYCLAILFGYSLGFIYAMTKKPEKFYREFKIPNGKKTRRIFAPKVAIKVIQKWLGEHLSSNITFHPHVYGFVKGRSFVDAAKQHIGARWVLAVDIDNFFPSTSKESVLRSLTALGYSDDASELISDLCCLHDSLAQGSPASPVLSNLCMQSIDDSLIKLSEQYNVKVTRYADDITFSGTGEFDDGLKQYLQELIENSGFQLNHDKTYFADSETGKRLKVHGLLVKKDSVRLTKGYRNKIRIYKHMLKNGRISDADFLRISGHVRYSDFIDSIASLEDAT